MKRNLLSRTNYFKIFFLLIFLILALVISKKPKTDSKTNWDPLFAIQTEIKKSDSVYQFSNVRDWSYKDNQIVEKEYADFTLDPELITDVWFVIEPFGSWDGIAHTYFTFDFSDSDPISFSLEARREMNESYSFITGLFREFELMYTWGAESDFLVRRAVYLDHPVYMYPLQIPDSWKKNLLIKLIESTMDIQKNPRFYNTLTSNCTNTLANIVNEIRPNTLPFHYARVLTGYSDDLLYKYGYIPNDKSFKEIKSEYYVTDIVRQNYQKEDFSQLLRDSLK